MAEICARQGLDADAAEMWKRFLRASYLMRAEHHHDPQYQRYDEAWARQFERVFKVMKLGGDAWAAAEYFREKLADASAFGGVERPIVLRNRCEAAGYRIEYAKN